MAVHYTSPGLVIKKIERGEADQVFSVYTRDFGKLNIVGKAIRKTASKLRGGADLFYLSDIEFIQGKSQKTLTDAALVENYSNIRKDIKKMRVALQIADALDGLVGKEEKDEQVWQLFNEAFSKLNDWKNGNSSEIVYYYFFWNLVSILGWKPELARDSVGGKKVDSDLPKILKIIIKKDWPILSRLKIEPIHSKLLKDTSEWYNEAIIAGGSPTSQNNFYEE